MESRDIGDIEGETTLPGKCDELRATLFLAKRMPPPPFPPNYIKKPLRNITDTFEPITPNELYSAIPSTCMSSSPGSDDIRWSMVTALHTVTSAHLCNIYNSLLVNGVHHASWKTAKCIVIPKTGKKKKDRAKSCKPISLLSCLEKTLE